MRWAEVPRPVVLIVGPTAVGKTLLSLQLAEALDAEIVSSDSRLLYRGMDIGTAKPEPSELRRVPHHLIDVAEPDENWSLAVFQAAARRVISDIHRRGKLPILAGGTGQYVRALVEDWDLPTQPPDPRLRSALERLGRQIGPEELHRRLASIDPTAASRIDPRNLRRTVRALEVMLLTGRRFSDQYRRLGSPYSRLIIGLRRPREELYRRIDERIDQMIAQGWAAEVKALLDEGYTPDLPTFSAIGYREVAQALQGQITLEEAVTLTKRKTRQFVRRQAAWFRETDPAIHWFDARTVRLPDLLTLVEDRRAWLLPERVQ